MKNEETKNCIICGKEFKTVLWNKKTCSVECIKAKNLKNKKEHEQKYREKKGCSYGNDYQKKHRSKMNRKSRERFAKRDKVVYREKRNCRNTTDRLLKQYSMKKEDEICYICGEGNTIVHHNDYSNPYNITFLCKVCHGRLHKYFPKDYNLYPIDKDVSLIYNKDR